MIGIKLGANTAIKALLLLIAISITASLKAQIDAGGITGTITDSSGAIVVGAKVTLINEATRASQSTESTSTGVYNLGALKPGLYTLRATSTGYSTWVTESLSVHVQQTLTVDINLTAGAVTQQVIVTANTPQLQAENAAIGQTIGTESVNNLPLNGRNWVSLAQLSAGVSTAPVGQPTSSAGTSGSAFFSVGGVSLWQNDIRLNGINNNIELFGGASIGTNATITPPPDAIQEFKIQNGDYNAEFGHSTGGIVNAVTKSGTSNLHGNLWEYLRNEAFDANDYISNLNKKPRAEYRQNQFGGTIGGPVYIPKFYKQTDKTFFFFSYQGTRIIIPASSTASVPTTAMRNSGYTNLQDILTYTTGTKTDALGRTIALGTILDPATTRVVAAGATDPVSLLPNRTASAIYVRDPFYNGGSVAGIKDFTGVKNFLNVLPASRLNANSISLLGVYPSPTKQGVANNFFYNPKQTQNGNQYDLRIDHSFSSRDLVFVSVDWNRTAYDIPGALPGIAVGQSGALSPKYPASAIAVGYTHIFSPSLVNDIHFGRNHINQNSLSSYGNVSGIPAMFGIQGIPQIANNGGLPPIGLSGLTSLGVRGYNPTLSDIGSYEVVENLTKSHGSHTFKMGVQFDHIRGTITQPPYGRGNFSYTGQYSDVVNNNSTLLGVADLLLTPTGSTVPNGIDYLGGLTSYSGSNFAQTSYTRHYIGAYAQDDWKVTPGLTLNLGLRWDYFPPYSEGSGRQANFIADGGNGPTGTLYIPTEGCSVPRSASFDALLASSNIQLKCVPKSALGQTQVTNFSPRVGFAYQFLPKTVIRGGYGIAYGALANTGYSGTLGANYPFEYTVTNNSSNSYTRFLASNGQTATVQNAFAATNYNDPSVLSGSGLNLIGRQLDYHTPYLQVYNLTIQNQFTSKDSIQAGYVGSVGRHLNAGAMGHNSTSKILPPGTNVYNYIPFPKFSYNSNYETTNAVSSYNSLQLTYVRQAAHGLSVLANYTFSRCLSDQATINSVPGTYRAPWLPGFGIDADYTLCDTHTAHITHLSGTYELPIGSRRAVLGNANRFVDAIVGGWSTNFIVTYQSGQPFSVTCPTATTANFGCFALVKPGADIYAGGHTQSHWLNASAFANPPVATAVGQSDYSPLGAKPMQALGPGYFNMDASFFKDFILPRELRLQFRAESFNVTNNAQLGQPASGSLNFLNTATFSTITSLRGGPRRVQLALKFAF